MLEKFVFDYGACPNAGLSVITGVVHHFELQRESLGFTHHSRFEVAKLLVEAGVDVTVQENDGYTPLHAAARHAEGDLFIKMLLDKGLDPSIHNLYGQTPLHDACGQNHVKCVAMLIQNGADINKRHGSSRPPIFDSIDKHSHESIELLLKAGASLNFVDSQRDGATILHWLARHRDMKTFELFQSADVTGLNTEQKNSASETALEYFDRINPDTEECMREALVSLLDRVRQCNTSTETLDDCLRYGVRLDGEKIPGAWIDELQT